MSQTFSGWNTHSGLNRLASSLLLQKIVPVHHKNLGPSGVSPVSLNTTPLWETVSSNPSIVWRDLNVLFVIFPFWSILNVFSLVSLVGIRTKLVVKNLGLIVLNDLGGAGKDILPGMACGATDTETGCSVMEQSYGIIWHPFVAVRGVCGAWDSWNSL